MFESDDDYLPPAPPGSFGYHEMMHSACICMDLWNGFVMDTFACEQDAEAYAAAEHISALMYKFYNDFITKHAAAT